MNRLHIVAIATLLAATAVVAVSAGDKKKAGKPADVDAVAYVEGRAITVDDVDARLGSQLAKIRQQEYELRRSAVDQLVADALLENEAKARGMTVDDLIAAEVDAKVTPVTPEEVDAYYQANKSRLQGRTLDQLRPDIERFLGEQKQAALRAELIDRLKDKGDVRIVLSPPRADVPIPAGAPSKGPADAPVTIVEFSDFQCGYCRRAESTVARVLGEYGDKIRLVYRDYPLGFHPRAMPAAAAARCAGEQDKFWEYHENLFQGGGDLGDEDLARRARDLQLDMDRFNACYESGSQNEAVQQSASDGSKLGVTGTPTFFINGRMLVGAQPYEAFKEVIDEELAISGHSENVGG